MIDTKKIRLSCVSIFLLLSLTGSVYGADQLQRAAQHMVDQLNKRYPLQGVTIQVTPSSFTGQEERQLALSQALYDVVTASLSNAGTMISAERQGRKTLTLRGFYSQNTDDALSCNLVLKQMGMEGATDIAVAQAQIEKKDIEGFLCDGLDQAAASLIRRLDELAIVSSYARFALCTPVPLQSGMPTRKLSAPFKKAVQEAMQCSDLFGTVVAVGGSSGVIRIEPGYALSPEGLLLQLRLINGKQRPTLVRTTLALPYVESALLQPYDDRHLKVCVQVRADGRRDIQPTSRKAKKLIGTATQILRQNYGINIVPCTNTSTRDRQLTLQLRTHHKKTAANFTIVQATLQGEVKDGNGSNLGSLGSSGEFSGLQVRSQPSWLYEQLLSGESMDKLTGLLLAYP